MNKDFTYLIKLQAIGDSAVAKLSAATERFETTLDKVNAKVETLGRRTRTAGTTGVSAFNSMGSSAAQLIGTLGIVATTMGSLQATAKFEGFERSINFSSAGKGAENLSFLNSTIDTLALNQKAATEGFAKLSGGVMGTGITAAQTRDIFKSVSEGTTVMGLSADESKGIFMALSQMASKGTVSAEELRGQLGERLPGAFGIAARSMGVTQQALGKMLERGEVLATDFLPKFAAEMHKTFGQAALASTDSATANFNRFDNSLLQLQLTFGEKIMPTVTAFLNGYLIPAVDWLGQHIDLIFKVGGAALFAYGGFYALKAIGIAWNAVTFIGNQLLGIRQLQLYFGGGAYGFYAAMKILATEATLSFNAALVRLNLTFLKSPIFWIPAAIIAVGAAVVWAWGKFESFRGFIIGMWEVLKVFGKYLYDFAIAPLMAFGKILWGVFTQDFSLIRQGIADGATALKNMATDYYSAGKTIGEAYNKGWNSGAYGDLQDKYYSERDDRQGALGGVSFGASASGGGSTDKNDAAKKTATGITGGGSKTITIQVGKIGIDTLTMQVTNVKEGAEQIREILLRELTQVVNMANQIQ